MRPINNRGREPQNLIFMSVKIRLQRHGKKGKPFYWIVAADSRAKRDGKYLEKIGTYDPLTNPATVNLNVDSAVTWLQNGAQPTDTARDLLSSKGVMLKRHLLIGVQKGALTEEEAEKRFNAWVEEKESKLSERRDSHLKAKEAEKAAAAEAEAAKQAEEAQEDDGKTEIEKQAEAAEEDKKDSDQ